MIELLFIALFQAASGEPATTPSAEPAPTAAGAAEAAPATSAQPNPDERRCRAVRSTGSRVTTRRLCLTEEEREDLRQRGRNALDQQQIRSTQGGIPAG